MNNREHVNHEIQPNLKVPGLMQSAMLAINDRSNTAMAREASSTAAPPNAKALDDTFVRKHCGRLVAAVDHPCERVAK